MTVPPVPEGDVPVGGAEGHLSEEDAVLAALGEVLPAGAAAHGGSCPSCSAEIGRWRSVVALARAEERVELVPAPAGTWEAIAASVGVTTGVGQVRAAGSSRTPAPPVPLPASSPAVPGLPSWLVVAAALLVGAVGGVLGSRWLEDPSTPAAPEVRVLAAAVLDPVTGNGSGTADVVVAGGHRQLELRVSDVAPAAGGILEVWLLDEDGGLVSLGTLSGDDLTVTLPDDVDLDRFSTVDVSREPLDGNPAHSADSVLRGSLSGQA